jgi:predicted AAA+ superfamily ATPase
MDGQEKPFERALRARVAGALADTPVVALLGPRQCGKSTLAHTFAPEFAYSSLDDEALLRAAHHDPVGFVAALPARAIIDEAQRSPALLRAIKLAVDRERRPGRFLLTGSANLLMLPQLGDSLAGRMETIVLQPLAEAEKARRPGAWLEAFLGGALKPAIRGAGGVEAGLAERLVAGGYPEPLTRAPERARQWHRQYVKSIVERDVHEIARVKDAGDVARLLELLALRTGELLNVSNVSNDLGLRRETIEHHLAILERLFLVRRLPAWSRSEAKRLVRAPKIHLLDSGLAATLGGLAAEDWTARRERFGHLLETFVVQQIVAQAGWTSPELQCWHYRDKDLEEVDLVLTLGRRTWGVEVKSSATVTESDGRGLRRLVEQCGRDFQCGALIYTGTHTLPMGDPRLLAVPVSSLWSR